MDALPPNAFEPRFVDPELASDFLKQAESFERDKLKSLTRQRNALCGLSAVLGCAVISLGVAIASLSPLVRVQTEVLPLDTAGIINHNFRIKAETVSETGALNRAYAAQYVTSRESYAADRLATIQKDVAVLSSEQEYKRYVADLKAPSGPLAQIGRKGVVVARVKTPITPVDDKKGTGTSGIMRVYFQRIVKLDDSQPVSEPWVAELHFDRVGGTLTDSQMLDNPIGWVVTSYASYKDVVH